VISSPDKGSSPSLLSSISIVATCISNGSSLVPRPYAHVHRRVCLHKSKFLGLLQKLKVTNEIVKQRLLE